MKLKILARMSQKDLRQIFEVLNINKIWKILRTLFTFMPLAIVNIRQMCNLGLYIKIPQFLVMNVELH